MKTAKSVIAEIESLKKKIAAPKANPKKLEQLKRPSKKSPSKEELEYLLHEIKTAVNGYNPSSAGSVVDMLSDVVASLESFAKIHRLSLSLDRFNRQLWVL